MDFKSFLVEVKITSASDFSDDKKLRWYDRQSQEYSRYGYSSMSDYIKTISKKVISSINSGGGFDVFGRNPLKKYPTASIVGNPIFVAAIHALRPHSWDKEKGHQYFVQIKPIELFIVNQPNSTFHGSALIDDNSIILNIPALAGKFTKEHIKEDDLYNTIAHELTHIFDLKINDTYDHKIQTALNQSKPSDPDHADKYDAYRQQNHEKLAKQQGHSFSAANDPTSFSADNGYMSKDRYIDDNPEERRRYLKNIYRIKNQSSTPTGSNPIAKNLRNFDDPYR